MGSDATTGYRGRGGGRGRRAGRLRQHLVGRLVQRLVRRRVDRIDGSCSNSAIQKDLFTKGALTVATDKPVYPPWFESNNPANGKGYESAVAYAVAKQLGFKPSQVHWAYEPFNASYAPGPKKFDFDINEISYTPQRATAVTFSNSYYDVQQALVALKGTPIITQHTPADLQGLRLRRPDRHDQPGLHHQPDPADQPAEGVLRR